MTRTRIEYPGSLINKGEPEKHFHFQDLGMRDYYNDIHRHGRRYRAQELVQKVTGQPLSHKPLMDYMTRKFGELYEF